jgi:hypothetical protein
LVSKNAVAGSRPPPAAADSKAGPARGKDNPAPTWAEAAPPVGALAEAADRPAAGPASADRRYWQVACRPGDYDG